MHQELQRGTGLGNRNGHRNGTAIGGGDCTMGGSNGHGESKFLGWR